MASAGRRPPEQGLRRLDRTTYSGARYVLENLLQLILNALKRPLPDFRRQLSLHPIERLLRIDSKIDGRALRAGMAEPERHKRNVVRLLKGEDGAAVP